MSDFINTRTQVNQARQERKAAKKRLDAAREALRKLDAEIADRRRTAGVNDLKLAKMVAERSRLNLGLAGLSQNYLAQKASALGALNLLAQLADPWDQVAEADDHYPFLLFPVRIETRFMTGLRNRPELWVRIYPDDIAIETREEILTEDEVKSAKTFWTDYLQAQTEPDAELRKSAQLGAWRFLTASYGPNRSGWIIRTYRPQEIGLDPDGTLRVISVPAGEPTFPEPQTQADPWSQAPNSTVMPDRFVVIGIRNGVEEIRFKGNPIPEPLICGPNPSVLQEEGEGFLENEDFTQVDEEMKWMVDFEQAVQVGMGMKIPLSADQASQGFDRLLVLGLRLSSDPEQAKTEVEELLHAHRYSDAGFSLLPVGTPTNNTQKGETSGYSSFTLGDEESFRVEFGEPLFSTSDDWINSRDGMQLARFLGIAPETLMHTHHADGLDQRDARAINQLLWPATLGYFLEEMMDPYFGPNIRSQIQAFMVNYVSGRGPVPSIRVGDQPYGILPTTAFSAWKYPQKGSIALTHLEVGFALAPSDSFFLRTFNVLQGLDAEWEKLAKEVSFAGKEGDAQAHLLNILGLHAGSNEFHQRFAAGFAYVWNLLQHKKLNTEAVKLLEYVQQFFAGNLYEIGFDEKVGLPEIFNKIFFTAATQLTGPVVQDDPLSESNPLKGHAADGKNYLEWLGSSGLEAIRAEDFGKIDDVKVNSPKALLYLMMRHGMMLAWWDAAMKLRNSTPEVAKIERKEAEFIHISQEAPGVSKFKYLYETNPQITQNNLAIKDHIEVKLKNPVQALADPALRELANQRILLGLLSGRPTAALERAFTEHIDLCSYRLDAWKTGLITHRMHQLRQPVNSPASSQTGYDKGLYLGAFGWVENLRPANRTFSAAPASAPTELTQPGESPLVWDKSNAGYIHAPSLNHATAAAVLRNAYLTHADSTDPDRFAVNLSSERVRTALSLIEGIRNNQSLGALLGYNFERGLHDRNPETGLHYFIYQLRKKFPLVADKKTTSDPDVPIEQVEARNVIDGEAMLSAFEKSNKTATNFFRDLLSSTSPQPTNGQISVMVEELNRIANAMDAVKDVATAEEVYQVVQGNYERAGAMTKAIHEAAMPPIPEVIQTPRSGFALTNRVAMTLPFGLDPSLNTSNPWRSRGVSMTPRAIFEPGLNLWLGERLPEPQLVLAWVSWVAGGNHQEKVALHQLGIQPIDLLYVLKPATQGAAGELDQRISEIIRQKYMLGDDDPVTISYTDRTGFAAKEVTFFELFPLVESLQKLVSEGRPLQAEDLFLPNEEVLAESENPKGLDLEQLKVSVKNLGLAFEPLKIQLENAWAGIESGTPGFLQIDAMRNALKAISVYGMDHAFPQVVKDLEPLREQSKSAVAEAAMRWTKFQAEQVFEAEDNTEQKVEKLTQAVKVLLGADFKVIPGFEMRDKGLEMAKALDIPDLLSEAEGLFPLDDWLHGLARVRPRMNTLERATLLTANFGLREPELTAAQLPFRENDRWLGNNVPENYALEGDKLVLSLHLGAAWQAATNQAGLLLDEWNEVLPHPNETTGITFHFDRPNSEPPNTLLLAVSPDVTGSWDWNHLVATLNETLDAAKKRAVEPLQLDKSKYAQILPAIMVAASRYMLTIQTNLLANMIDLQSANPDLDA
ncbi:MAG: hypothetical protein H6581_24910 [Bacteroidia bacterium]|nr:hypothetical protein [Bacteroidia bacterium]